MTAGPTTTARSATPSEGGGNLTAIIYTAAVVAWRKSNLAANDPGVNVLAYLVPMFSLIWLFALSQVHLELVDYLIIGAAAIITANLLVNFESEIRWGFKVLVFALGTCGAIVYLRDDVFAFLGVGG